MLAVGVAPSRSSGRNHCGWCHMILITLCMFPGVEASAGLPTRNSTSLQLNINVLASAGNLRSREDTSTDDGYLGMYLGGSVSCG